MIESVLASHTTTSSAHPSLNHHRPNRSPATSEVSKPSATGAPPRGSRRLASEGFANPRCAPTHQIRAGPLPLTPFESELLLDGALGEWLGFQTLVRDPCPALDRQAERALREARFGTDHGCKLVP